MKLEEFLGNKALLKTATYRILLIITFAVGLVFVLFKADSLQRVGGYLTALLGPFLTGLCMAYVLNVLLRFFEDRVFSLFNKRCTKIWPKLRRMVCVVLSLVVVGAVVCGVVFYVLPELGRSLEILAVNAPIYIKDLLAWATVYLEKMNITSDQIKSLQIDWTGLFNGISQYASTAMDSIVTVTMSVATGLFAMVMGFIFAINMLFGKERLVKNLRRVLYAFFPAKRVHKAIEISVLANRIFSGFVRGQLTESCILGVLCYAGMSVLRLEYALLISSIVAVSSLIPILGAYISMVMGAFILLLVNPWHCLYFIIFLLCLQQFEGNVIYPRVVGNSVGLPVIWVLFAIVVGGNFLGMPGILLGIPTCSVLYTLLRGATKKKLEKRGITDTEVETNDPACLHAEAEDPGIITEEPQG